METLQPPDRQRLSFGALLRQCRIAAGLTQEELAEGAGMSERNVRALEQGVSQRPHRATVEGLAATLGLSDAERAVFLAAARGRGRIASAAAAGAAVRTPLIGRAAELAVLERHSSGQGPPLLLLAGEPGIGKTSLLHAGATQALSRGLCVLAGGCRQQGGGMPFSPLLEALQRYLLGLPPSQLRQALHGCAWLVRLLPELASGPIEPLPAWTLSPEQEHRLLVEAIKQLLLNIAGTGSVLLVLDDLQWAAPDALRLLGTLVAASPTLPVRYLGAYRDTDAQRSAALVPLLGDLAQAQLVAQQRVGPLELAEAAALLEQAAGAMLQSAVRERILRRAGGVPFFLVSWAQTLQAGALGTASGGGDIPWTVALGVQQRMAVLPEGSSAVLEVAAVAGRTIARPLLAQVLGCPEADLVGALEAVCGARLLEEVGAHEYQFIHDVLREVVEARMSTARRALLHHRIAQALSTRANAAPVEMVAYHYAQTNDHAAAAAWLERAGDQAATALALDTALRYLRSACDRAAAGGAEPAVRSRLQEKLGDLCLLLFDLDQAEEAFAHARALDTDRVRRAELWRKGGVIHARHGKFADALAAFAAAEREGVAGSLPVTLQAAVGIERALVCYFQSDLDATQIEVGRALALLAPVPQSAAVDALLARAGWIQAIIDDLRGHTERMRAHSGEVLAHARRIGDQQFVGRAFFGLGVTAWRAGQFAQAEEQLHAAQEVLVPLGEKEFQIGCLWCLGAIAHSRGDLPAAERHFRQGLDLLDPASHPFHAALLLEELGKVARDQGDLGGAQDRFRLSLETRQRIGDQRGIAQSWTGLGTVAAARGDRAAAARWCRKARRQARRCGAPVAEVDAATEQLCLHLRASADGAPSRGGLRLLRALVRYARALLAERTLPEASMRLALLGAELDLLLGLPGQARRTAEDTLRSAAADEMRPLAALAHRVLGQCALAEGHAVDARRWLDAALAQQGALGFTLAAADTRRLLAAVRRS